MSSIQVGTIRSLDPVKRSVRISAQTPAREYVADITNFCDFDGETSEEFNALRVGDCVEFLVFNYRNGLFGARHIQVPADEEVELMFKDCITLPKERKPK